MKKHPSSGTGYFQEIGTTNHLGDAVFLRDSKFDQAHWG
jgi:hypothetical protein